MPRTILLGFPERVYIGGWTFIDSRYTGCRGPKCLMHTRLARKTSKTIYRSVALSDWRERDQIACLTWRLARIYHWAVSYWWLGGATIHLIRYISSFYQQIAVVINMRHYIVHILGYLSLRIRESNVIQAQHAVMIWNHIPHSVTSASATESFQTKTRPDTNQLEHLPKRAVYVAVILYTRCRFIRHDERR